MAVPVPLVIKIVSKNWQEDYLIKLAEYETLGIPEYWIVDY
ncbi:Uma2 family endonuclease [Nodosilinea sp. FACHB-13]